MGKKTVKGEIVALESGVLELREGCKTIYIHSLNLEEKEFEQFYSDLKKGKLNGEKIKIDLETKDNVVDYEALGVNRITLSDHDKEWRHKRPE
jgi:hypothetical protein